MEVSGIEQARAIVPTAHAIVNCSGLGAATLGGVNDATLIGGGVRGQTLRVRAERRTSFFSCVTGDKQRPVYVIPQGDGTCVVGGLKVAGDVRPAADPALADEMLRVASAWCPAIRDAEVLSHAVGWRPFREAGVRLEIEREGAPHGASAGPGAAPRLIHNYGHGDVGVILAWGCADDVVELVKK